MANPVRIVIEASTREATQALADLERRAGDSFSGAARSAGALDRALAVSGGHARDLSDQAAKAGGSASAALGDVRGLGEGWAGVVASMEERWSAFTAMIPALPGYEATGPVREAAGAPLAGEIPQAGQASGALPLAGVPAGGGGPESGPQGMSVAWGTAYDEIRVKGEETWDGIGRASDRTLRKFQQAVVSVAMGASDSGEAVRAVMRTMAEQVVGIMVRLGVQRLVLSRLSLGAQATETASQVAGMSAIAASAAPAAALTSVATAGGSAAAGAAGFAAAMAAMTAVIGKLLSGFAGGAAHAARGGVFDRPTLTVFGEEGPEAVVPLSPGRRREAGAVLGRIAPRLFATPSSGSPGPVSVSVNFSGPVHLAADREAIKAEIGWAITDAVRGA